MFKITNVAKRKMQRESEITILVCRGREEKGESPSGLAANAFPLGSRCFRATAFLQSVFYLCFRHNKKDRFVLISLSVWFIQFICGVCLSAESRSDDALVQDKHTPWCQSRKHCFFYLLLK